MQELKVIRVILLANFKPYWVLQRFRALVFGHGSLELDQVIFKQVGLLVYAPLEPYEAYLYVGRVGGS